MTIEDVLDRIGHHNMAVAVQASGLSRILDDPTTQESARWIHSEAIASHRLIVAVLDELRRRDSTAVQGSTVQLDAHVDVSYRKADQ